MIQIPHVQPLIEMAQNQMSWATAAQLGGTAALSAVKAAAAKLGGEPVARMVKERIDEYRKKGNHDLEKAIAEALKRGALATYKAREKETPEHKAWDSHDALLLRQLADNAQRLIIPPPGSYLGARSGGEEVDGSAAGAEAVAAIVQALLFADEAALDESLWVLVAPWAQEAMPPERMDPIQAERMRPGFQQPSVVRTILAKMVLTAFNEVLKDDKHKRAWIAFVRDFSRESHRLLSGQIEAATELLVQIAELERAMQRILLQEPLIGRLAGNATQTTVDELIGRHGELHGRDDELQALDDFLEQHDRGVLIVKAGAGFGKTALLARWVRKRNEEERFTVYHFFSQQIEALRQTKTGMRGLLRQVCLYYAPSDERLPDFEESGSAIAGLIAEYKGGRGNDPLVIVIDSLDEADERVPYPLPEELPAGVFLIASVRETGYEDETYLDEWRYHRPPDAILRLDRLTAPAIGAWLRAIDNGRYHGLAADDPLIERIAERTHGFPLYLRFLFDEWVERRVELAGLGDAVADTPGKFGDYVAQQLGRLARSLVDRAKDLFSLMAVALGPMSEDDIYRYSDQELELTDVLGLPWEVTRWLLIDPNGDRFSFAHPLLAEEFRRALRGQATRKAEALISGCEAHRYESPYALRYHARHLREAKHPKHDEPLFALALDEQFAAAQEKVFPSEPELTLATIRLALERVFERDESCAVEAVKLILAHADRLTAIRNRSPLSALEDGDLPLAIQLAERWLPPERVRWLLLLAWTASTKTDGADNARTLMRVARRHASPEARPGDISLSFLLTRLIGLDDDLLVDTGLQLLDDAELAEFSSALLRSSSGAFALEVARAIREEGRRTEALAAVAATRGRQVDVADAALLANALSRARALVDIWKEANALAKAATGQQVALVAPALLAKALATARASTRSAEWRAEALAAVATALVQQNDPAAPDVFAEALAAERESKGGWGGEVALAAVAAALGRQAHPFLQVWVEVVALAWEWGFGSVPHQLALADIGTLDEAPRVWGRLPSPDGAQLLSLAEQSIGEQVPKGTLRPEFAIAVLQGLSYPETAIGWCGLLARLEPNHAGAIGDLLRPRIRIPGDVVAPT